jgi:hypothetical protein
MSYESEMESRAQADDTYVGIMCVMMDHEECEDDGCECGCHKSEADGDE